MTFPTALPVAGKLALPKAILITSNVAHADPGLEHHRHLLVARRLSASDHEWTRSNCSSLQLVLNPADLAASPKPDLLGHKVGADNHPTALPRPPLQRTRQKFNERVHFRFANAASLHQVKPYDHWVPIVGGDELRCEKGRK